MFKTNCSPAGSSGMVNLEKWVADSDDQLIDLTAPYHFPIPFSPVHLKSNLQLFRFPTFRDGVDWTDQSASWIFPANLPIHARRQLDSRKKFHLTIRRLISRWAPFAVRFLLFIIRVNVNLSKHPYESSDQNQTHKSTLVAKNSPGQGYQQPSLFVCFPWQRAVDFSHTNYYSSSDLHQPVVRLRKDGIRTPSIRANDYPAVFPLASVRYTFLRMDFSANLVDSFVLNCCCSFDWQSREKR